MEAGSIAPGLVVFAGLIILNALLAAAHAALTNAHKPHLRALAENGNARAARALALSEDSARLLTVRQVTSALLRFAEAGVLTLTFAQPEVGALTGIGLSPDAARWVAYGGALVIGATIAVLCGELIPASFAATQPDTLAMVMARPMKALYAVLWPISGAMIGLSNRLVALFGGRGETHNVTEEAIKTLVDAGSEEGVIEDDAKQMIYSIFQFGDTIAREIMVPRIDIVALDADTPLAEALDVVRAKGHSRIPVYEEIIDRICGLLYAKDLLAVDRADPRKVRELMRPAYFVPESKKAGTLLEDLQQRKIHMAIVIDEYGGTAGLVTLENLMEEIVGDIQDEYDFEAEAEYVKVSDDEYVFDAGIHLDDVNTLLDEELPTGDSDTLGGYVFSTLGKVPLAGEVFRVDGLEVKVEAITGRRIRKVRVKRLPKPNALTPIPLPSDGRGENATPSDDSALKSADPDKNDEKEPVANASTSNSV
ncbi:MAG: hemolysin family protein [Aggregatilineales bacterium]